MKELEKKHCFIIGAKCIGQYGGYETFVKKLLEYIPSDGKFQFHVASKANGDGYMKAEKLNGIKRISNNELEYCGARIFLIRVPEKIGAAQAIYYDLKALKKCCIYITEKQIKNAAVYILACRIGPFMQKYVKELHSLGAKLYVNPDGHEWMRTKWPPIVRRYWKESEKLMVKAADTVICDSINIEKYIQSKYMQYNPKTLYIAYGTDVMVSGLSDCEPQYVEWLRQWDLQDGQFYISVGRFVPENNFEVMIREFMNCKSQKDFAIITTDNPKYMKSLEQKLHFSSDKRIKFVGTVYDQKLLRKIRERAYGYLHGHEVGGTNPSLLEALGSTQLNLLLDVRFNREVAEDAGLYWSKEFNSLTSLIHKTEQLKEPEIAAYERAAKKRIQEAYSWEFIADKYRQLFNSR